MKRKFNILGLTGSFPRHDDDHLGLHISTWADALTSRGHKVSIVAPAAPFAASHAMRNGVEITRVGPTRFWPKDHLWYGNGAPDNLRRNPWAWPEALGFGRRIDRLALPHPKPDLIWSHWAVPFGILGGRLARRFGIKHIVQIHGSDLRMLERLPFGGRIARHIRRHAASMVCVTQEQRHRLLSLFGDEAPLDSVTVLPIGVSIPPMKRRPAVSGKAPQVLVMSRLIKAKGVDLVIRALAEHEASAELRIVGEGMERHALQVLAMDLGVKTDFVGACAPPERWKHLAECDLLVHASRPTSRQIEGYPVVIGEAQAMGVPVVGTRLGGISEALSDGAGLLVRPDVSSIARAIDSVLLDPLTRSQIESRAARKITPLLWPNLIDSYCSVIEKTVP